MDDMESDQNEQTVEPFTKLLQQMETEATGENNFIIKMDVVESSTNAKDSSNHNNGKKIVYKKRNLHFDDNYIVKESGDTLLAYKLSFNTTSNYDIN